VAVLASVVPSWYVANVRPAEVLRHELGALDRLTSGRIVVHDVDLSVLRGPDEVAYQRHKVGFVFQALLFAGKLRRPIVIAVMADTYPLEKVSGYGLPLLPPSGGELHWQH
jgi:hypothetical protein